MPDRVPRVTDAPPSAPETPEEPPAASGAGPNDAPGRRKFTAAHPLVAGALFVALLSAASRALYPGPSGAAAQAAPAPSPSYELPCPAGSVADFPRTATKATAEQAAPNARAVCIPVPLAQEGARLSVLPDALERRADRPEDFTRYALPVPATQLVPAALDENAESAADALRLVAPPGSVVRALRLEGQLEPTRVVFAGQRDGWTVITAHVVPRERGAVTFLLVHTGFDSLPAGFSSASPEKPLAVEPNGTLGQSQALLFAARQLRKGVELAEAIPRLGADATIATDARNVLELAAKAPGAP